MVPEALLAVGERWGRLKRGGDARTRSLGREGIAAAATSLFRVSLLARITRATTINVQSFRELGILDSVGNA